MTKCSKKGEKAPLLPKQDGYQCSAYGSKSESKGQSLPASWLAWLFFSWLNPLLALGNRRALEFEDLYQLSESNRAANVAEKFQKAWKDQCQKAAASSKKTPSSSYLVWALAKAFGAPFLLAGFLKLAHDVLLFVTPIVIQGVMKFLSDPDAQPEVGWYYVAAVFFSGIIQSFCLRQYFYYCYLVGMRIRSAIVMAVYHKALRLSSAARQRTSAGEITNLMSVDAQRLQDALPYLHGLWYALFQIGVSIYMLWQELGPSCMAGTACIILTIPIMGFIAKMMRRLQKQLMQVKDDRLKICYDVLAGMKVIKLQAWENSFIDKVMSYRKAELARLRTYILARSASVTVFNAVPSLVAVASFFTYVMTGNFLDVSTALTSVSLFNILRFPLFMLPQVINNAVEATVSFKRLTSFLQEEERRELSSGDLKDVGIRMKNADFNWGEKKKTDDNKAVEDKEEFEGLRNISLELKMGELCAVIGPVGSGKSTLVAAILGEANCTSGSPAMLGSVAYVSQQPFVQNATLRDNVLFGREFNSSQYKKALRVSALEADIEVLPGGDLTEIGEKGITLSGGQRMRVSIARAVYQDADIYIFDDPLAAVDGHVGRKIFEECILGALSSKLRLLVTNGLTYLPQCPHIIALDHGEIAEEGTYEELSSKKKGVVYHLLKADNVTAATVVDSNKNAFRKGSSSSIAAETDALDSTENEKSLSRKSSENDAAAALEAERKQKAANGGGLMTDEERSVGDVSLDVYRAWAVAAGGLGAAMAIVCIYIFSQMLTVGSTAWLSVWSESATPATQMYYLYVFCGLNAAYTVLVYFQSLCLYLCGVRASRKMFKGLLETVMRAPMRFFDTTPTGRIINRLSRDIYAVDEQIPASWGMYLRCIIISFATLVTVAYVTPWFIVMLVPISFGYYSSQRYFIKTSRELQRLDSMSRSPVYAQLGETLDGIESIHAYGVVSRFIHSYESVLDRNQRAYFLNFAANCWLGLRLEFSGTLIATGAALFAVLEHGSANAFFVGLAGVSLSYALSTTQTLNWSVRMASQLQTQMVSVERIKTYTDMPREAALVSRHRPDAQWPFNGKIEFINVSMRYRDHLPLVLRNLSFTIHGCEKVGVVGRTGAGKSSLMTVLMRLVELDPPGVIRIDDIDISKIGLHELRSKVSIISQEPILFAGTIRSNVDPFSQYSDIDIWQSLSRAKLAKSIKALDEPVSERGANFSVGERQLLCIARSLLKKSKIILMDEATASIDIQTDMAIQQSMRDEFVGCTCLTIAHRINTIMDSDRVLVMDNGSVAEFDTPDNLLKIQQGLFASLVKEWKKE